MDPREHSSRSVAWGFQWLQSFVSRMKASLHWRLSLESSQGQFLVTRGEGQGGGTGTCISDDPRFLWLLLFRFCLGFNVVRLGFAAVFLVLLERRDRSLMCRLTSRIGLICAADSTSR